MNKEKLIIDADWYTLVASYVPILTKEERAALHKQKGDAKQMTRKAPPLRNEVLPSSFRLGA